MADLLVVDDSRVMREMIIACLRPLEGVSFSQASSGLEAIEQLTLRSFDALVLDLNMPDIDGYEVLSFVRAQDQLRRLPIVVVSSRGDDASRSRAFESGATKFLTKPFAPDQILAELRTLLVPSSGSA
jgi:two-component system chemotaxis response regulator CheY